MFSIWLLSGKCFKYHLKPEIKKERVKYNIV